MPDILRVRYLGGATASIPLAGRDVDPDCVFDLPGRVVEDQEDADHVLVEVGNPPERRTLPRALYKLERAPKTTAKPKE